MEFNLACHQDSSSNVNRLTYPVSGNERNGRLKNLGMLLPHYITGQGPCADRVLKVANEYRDRVIFHGILDKKTLANLMQSCNYGVNIQSSSDPISNVTFPSKTFDCVNAGLGLVSTRAAGVEKVWGDFPIYLNEESVHSLSESIQIACSGSRKLKDNLPLDFMPEKTTERLKAFFEELSV